MDSRLQPSASVRSRIVCRQFQNGTCRFGSRCHFLHEQPVQICRFFLKGVCWYNDRCRFIHSPLPDGDAAVASRRGSAPNVSAHDDSHLQPHRRGSEPAVLHTQEPPNQDHSGSESLFTVSNSLSNTGHVTTDITEEGTQDHQLEQESSLSDSFESATGTETTQGGAADGGNQQGTSVEEQTKDAGAAAAPSVDETDTSAQSENIVCGICMDTVSEKADPSERLFGLLPNCNHAFCLKCIVTWRKTKDLLPDVVKSCPQCRVKSGFYVANKNWVEGEAKETVIATFKEKCRKRRCSYYMRDGCCPFKSDCLYWHDKFSHQCSFMFDLDEAEDDLDLIHFLMAMALFPDDDDDFPFNRL